MKLHTTYVRYLPTRAELLVYHVIHFGDRKDYAKMSGAVEQAFGVKPKTLNTNRDRGGTLWRIPEVHDKEAAELILAALFWEAGLQLKMVRV